MSTKSYLNMLTKIQIKINKGLKHPNTIIIGDNSAGKSELLKLIIESNKENCYFIDCVNRTFDINKISKFNIENYDFKNVVKTRLLENYFNIKDSFDFDYGGTGAIEMLYFEFETEICRLFKEFVGLDFKFEFVKEEIIGEKRVLKIGKNINRISTGFQAIVRLLLEILFYDRALSMTQIQNPTIVIDEVTEFLSAKNESNILGFLMQNFPKINFIITTHSADVIANSNNFNIIALVGDKFEYMDGDDYQSITDVRELFNKIYNFDNKGLDNDNDILLKNLFNLKINGIWSDSEEKQISIIKKEDLSNMQLLLLSQIEKW